MLQLCHTKLLKLQWVPGKPHVETQEFSLCGFGAFGHKAKRENCGFNTISSKTILSISMKKKSIFSGLWSYSSGPEQPNVILRAFRTLG
jgi:hypothetical protein